MAEEMDNRQDPNEKSEALGEGENGDACVGDCACHAVGGGGKTRMVIGLVVLAIALTLVARAFLKGRETRTQAETDAFSASQVQGGASEMAGTAGISATQREEADVVTGSGGKTGAAATSSPALQATKVGTPLQTKHVVCGELINSLGDLNSRAMDSDGVFVFLAGKDAGKARGVVPVIEETAGKIRGRGTSLAIFTLKAGSPEYRKLAKQVPPPGVLAMVKGRGASAVSGDVTESKLMQAFVAASGGGGCGPAPSSGCCP